MEASTSASTSGAGCRATRRGAQPCEATGRVLSARHARRIQRARVRKGSRRAQGLTGTQACSMGSTCRQTRMWIPPFRPCNAIRLTTGRANCLLYPPSDHQAVLDCVGAVVRRIRACFARAREGEQGGRAVLLAHCGGCVDSGGVVKLCLCATWFSCRVFRGLVWRTGRVRIRSWNVALAWAALIREAFGIASERYRECVD